MNLWVQKHLMTMMHQYTKVVLLILSLWSLECVHSVSNSKRQVLSELSLNRRDPRENNLDQNCYQNSIISSSTASVNYFSFIHQDSVCK